METQGFELPFWYIRDTNPQRTCPRCGQKTEMAKLYCSSCGHQFIVSEGPPSVPLAAELARVCG